jgi:hypothetical protein
MVAAVFTAQQAFYGQRLEERDPWKSQDQFME